MGGVLRAFGKASRQSQAGALLLWGQMGWGALKLRGVRETQSKCQGKPESRNGEPATHSQYFQHTKFRAGLPCVHPLNATPIYSRQPLTSHPAYA